MLRQPPDSFAEQNGHGAAPADTPVTALSCLQPDSAEMSRMLCTPLVLDISDESGTIAVQAVQPCPAAAHSGRRETRQCPLVGAKCIFSHH